MNPEARDAQNLKERTRLIEYWSQMLAVSRRTASRWYDGSLRPAVSPASESGPLMRLAQAASILRVQPQALRKFGQRTGQSGESPLAEIKIVPVPWECGRKTIYSYLSAVGLMLPGSAGIKGLEAAAMREEKLVAKAIAAGVKPIVRISRQSLALLFESKPRRMSRSLPGWLDCKSEVNRKGEYIVISADEARAIKAARLEEFSNIRSHFMATPPAKTNLGQWLLNLAGAGQATGRPRCVIRINDKTLLRLTFPHRELDPVGVEIFGRGRKTAKSIIIEFDDGTRASILTSNQPAEN